MRHYYKTSKENPYRHPNEMLQSRSQTNTALRYRNMGNRETRHDLPRSCRDALSKKCQRIHKTDQNKKRSHNKGTRDLWNTRREIQIQTKLDQPS